jgi:hypothetical protein
LMIPPGEQAAFLRFARDESPTDQGMPLPQAPSLPQKPAWPYRQPLNCWTISRTVYTLSRSPRLTTPRWWSPHWPRR